MKNSDTAGSKGYDAGKKVSGIKRHLAVDTQGLPHAVTITTADDSDRKGAEAAFERCAEDLQSVVSVLADGGYTGEDFADEFFEYVGSDRTDRQAQRIAHIRGDSSALGGGAIFRLAGEMPPVMGEL